MYGHIGLCCVMITNIMTQFLLIGEKIMKKSRSNAIVPAVAAVVFIVLMIIAGVRCANGQPLANTAWSLLPPIIAIVLALIIKEAYSALFVGILVGAFGGAMAIRNYLKV